MKHLRLTLPLALVLSLAACNAPKKTETQTKPGATQSVSVTTVSSNDADQPATAADVERFYDVIQMRDQIKQITEVMSQQTRQMMQDAMGQKEMLPPGAEARLNALYEKILKNMPTEELLQSMVPIYAKHFTKGDIDAIVAFYASPVGKKMINKTPEITQEAMQASMATMQNYMKRSMDEVQQTIQSILQEQEEQNKTEAAQEPVEIHSASAEAPPAESAVW